MNGVDILGFQLGQYSVADDFVGNQDYNQGAYGGMDTGASTGQVSLGILSIAILGVMFFYITTRTRQF